MEISVFLLRQIDKLTIWLIEGLFLLNILTENIHRTQIIRIGHKTLQFLFKLFKNIL